MKMTKVIGALSALCALLVVACSSGSNRPSVASAEGPSTPSAAAMEDGDVHIALSEVPAIVRSAAMTAVSGFVIMKAERETEKGVVTYALEGTANGKKMEMDVSADGQIIKTETDDDDDDHDGDDDDDDDDDDGEEDDDGPG